MQHRPGDTSAQCDHAQKMKFNPLFHALLLGTVLHLTSCRQEDGRTLETAYYPNGRLHTVAALLHGRLDGRSVSYYQNGQVQTVSQWAAGQRTGVTRRYYPEGILKDSTQYRNDSVHGMALRYYRTGPLREVAHYTNGHRTGTYVSFDSLGHKVEQFTYNKLGEVIYSTFYDRHGKTAGGTPEHITEANDTISWGERYTGTIRFGYPLKGKVTMLVGVLREDRKALDRWPLVDTFQVVPQSKDGRFYFAYYPKRPGKNVLQYKFIQPGSPWDTYPRTDSVSVDGISVTRPFFVKKAP